MNIIKVVHFKKKIITLYSNKFISLQPGLALLNVDLLRTITLKF